MLSAIHEPRLKVDKRTIIDIIIPITKKIFLELNEFCFSLKNKYIQDPNVNKQICASWFGKDINPLGLTKSVIYDSKNPPAPSSANVLVKYWFKRGISTVEKR
jgi:hypothetical protein